MELAQTRQISPVVALGLILYQIGSWKRIRYGMTPHEIDRARSTALLHITDIDSYLAGSFSNTVAACLRWKDGGLQSNSTSEMFVRVAKNIHNYDKEIVYRFD